jgi:hypothetical protein
VQLAVALEVGLGTLLRRHVVLQRVEDVAPGRVANAQASSGEEGGAERTNGMHRFTLWSVRERERERKRSESSAKERERKKEK